MPTVIHNAIVVTGDEAGTVLYDGAVVIDKDRIVAVGPTDALLARYAGAEKVDGRGKAVLPGLANCHNHLCRVVGRSMSEDTNAPNKPPFSRTGQLPFPLIDRGQRQALARLAVIEAMRTGTTAILEVWGGIEDYADVLVASGLRFLACEQISDRARGVRVGQPDKFEADPELAAAGLKRISDLHAKWNGAGEGRFRVGVSCHAPDMCSPDMLQSAAKLQEKLDTYATIHLNQYWGEVQATQRSFGMLPTDYVEKQGFLSDRLVAAHCRCMTPEEEETLGKHGVTVSYNAAVAAQTGLAPNIQHLEASGCRIVLGSDEFTEDMVDVLRWAVCLERVRRGDGNSPQPEEAIRWGTSNGYKAIGVADGGVLKEGNKADLMVVGIARPHLVPFIRFVPAFVHNGQGRDVESVMVDGKWVMKDGKVLTIDEEAALRAADQVGRDLWFKVMKDNPSVPPMRGLDRRERI